LREFLGSSSAFLLGAFRRRRKNSHAFARAVLPTHTRFRRRTPAGPGIKKSCKLRFRNIALMGQLPQDEKSHKALFSSVPWKNAIKAMQTKFKRKKIIKSLKTGKQE
jgi:hypothetical protein